MKHFCQMTADEFRALGYAVLAVYIGLQLLYLLLSGDSAAPKRRKAKPTRSKAAACGAAEDTPAALPPAEAPAVPAPAAEAAAPKRGPGRPRKAPVSDAPAAPKRRPGRPRKTPAPEAAGPEAPAQAVSPATAETPKPEAVPAAPACPAPEINPAHPLTERTAGNGAFAGQVVSFTGRLPHMTREQAIRAVKLNGGRAFASMPYCTTLLVVGDRPGVTKLDKADEWIDHVRKITPAQFAAMLALPAPEA